eukprot:jgi/Mesvir1/26038/Mv09582-RA.1
MLTGTIGPHTLALLGWRAQQALRPASRFPHLKAGSPKRCQGGGVSGWNKRLGPCLPLATPRPRTAATRTRGPVCAQQQGGQEPVAVTPRDAGVLGTPFERTRLGMFAGIWLGYSVYYMCRLSFTYASPAMMADPALGLSITQVGAVASVFPVAYAGSKLLGGLLGDLYSPRQIFAGALLAAALVNLAFGMTSSLPVCTALWAINGVFQGLATPQCAKLLTIWFETAIRGRYWAVWNSSHNLGGVAITLLAGATSTLGWRYGMFLPGCLGVLAAIACYFVVVDKPEDKGFAPIGGVKASASGPAAPAKDGDVRSVLADVARLPAMWLLAASYFFVYAVRQGVINWAHFYLLNAKGALDIKQAVLAVSGFEMGGLLGNFSAGFLADYLVRHAGPGEGQAGKRVQVMIACTLGTLAAIGALAALPAHGMGAAHWAVLFAMGFFIYGPQLLVALVATDIVPKESVATANGFIGWIAYIGATASGYPLTLAVQKFGWQSYISCIAAGTLVQLLLFLPMWNMRSREQGSSRLSDSTVATLLRAAANKSMESPIVGTKGWGIQAYVLAHYLSHWPNPHRWQRPIDRSASPVVPRKVRREAP